MKRHPSTEKESTGSIFNFFRILLQPGPGGFTCITKLLSVSSDSGSVINKVSNQITAVNEVVKITLTREQYNEFIKTNIMTKNLLDLHSIKDEKCSICQENVNIGDNCSITPCNHLYHSTCSIEWFIKKCIRPTCPICRMDVRAAS